MFGGVFGMQITHQIDVLGFYCPIPLHETKKALQSLSFLKEQERNLVKKLITSLVLLEFTIRLN